MNTNTKYAGFQNVDGSKDPGSRVQRLNELYMKNSLLQARKRHAIKQAEVRAGHVVLDAGSSIGLDAIRMAGYLQQAID